MGLWKKGQFGAAGQKWSTAYANSGAAMKAGVAAPSRDPTQAAIAQQTALLAGFNQAVTGGMWAANLTRSGMAGWQSGMNAYAGSAAQQAAATKGASRVAAFGAAYGPQVMQQVSSLPARGPAGTNQQRSAQLNQWQHSQRGKNRAAWRGGATS